MLKRVTDHEIRENIPGITAGEASFPAFFPQGLEYSSPARGTWNIVHTGMLIPEAHEIFVCALGCLRGVVLTAAEMNAMNRYSAITIREENVLDGNMESLMIEGVEDVLEKLPYHPRAVLIYISCQHFFMGYDKDLVFRTLRERFPQIRFADCYMIPTLRKSGITPDQKMRIQLYSMLEPSEHKDPKLINLIGSNLPLSGESELREILSENGYRLQSIHDCRTFGDYLALADAGCNLYYEPIVRLSAEELEKRLGQKGIYLPFVSRPDDIEEVYERLSKALGFACPDCSGYRSEAMDAIRHAKELIGDTPIAVDLTLTFRIMNFTRMLLEAGFNVREIFADSALPEEEADFCWIKEHYPDIRIESVVRPEMRFADRNRNETRLALGQKAAYFTGTDHFVNLVESGGLFGYRGIAEMMALMEDAFLHEKDRKTIIQKKGLGCESCI